MSAGRRHVVIAGGGVAALEALLALRELAGHRLRITVLAPERDFVYRPLTVAEPFGRGEARIYPLRELLVDAGGGDLIWDSLDRVEPDGQVVVTGCGDRVSYDTLIVATGAGAREPLPGALTFRGRDDVPALRALMEDLATGSVRSVAFALAEAKVWPMPIYELALLAAAELRAAGSGAAVWLLTPESEPLELFGPEAGRAVAPLLNGRGVRLRTSSRPSRIEHRKLVLAGGGQLAVDRVVTLPALIGPEVVGLPSDGGGFIPVDLHGRVRGAANVYAAGDATSFPLKQGGLAAQQADAVAEAIAAEIGIPIQPTPFTPVLRGILITDGAPLYLRAEPHRLTSPATVAIEALPRRRCAAGASAASREPLWWPPGKIAGRYLAPFLATARPSPLSVELLTDRVPVPARKASEDERADALELALLLADCDARWGDYDSALAALAVAQDLDGSLPPDYEARRRRWSEAARAA